MTNNSNQYHFITHWKVKGTPEEVFTILDDIDCLTEWWPSVYLDLKVHEPGDDKGIGKVVELYTKGWLPYTLKWKFRSTRKVFPHTLALEAIGDFNGQCEWTIKADQDNIHCNLTYDWRISAEKPILRYFSFIMKPIFSANHHWAMRTGEESLKLELRRRRAKSEAESILIPKPPGPTFPHNLTNNDVL